MSYGVRSMMAFWLGGAAIPPTPEETPPPKFTGTAGLLYLRRKAKYAVFRKWKPRRRQR